MAEYITKSQYSEIKDVAFYGDRKDFNVLLKKYAGIEARPSKG